VPLSYEQRVLRVLQYIYENPTGDLSLDALADVAAMSRFHWHRVFRAMTGETCAQAVRRSRLNLAATWLETSDKSVTEIAIGVGYPNIHSFTRAFSERFGVPPATFRTKGSDELSFDHNYRGDFIMFKVELQEVPARRVGAILHRGAYTAVGRCFDELLAMASAKQLWPRSSGVAGIYYDNPDAVSEAELRSHAGLVFTDDLALPDELEEVRLVSGECAVLHYKGPYPAIKAAYDYLYGDWLPKSGKEPADAPPYELYLNSPADTAEEELLTDIYLPLAA